MGILEFLAELKINEWIKQPTTQRAVNVHKELPKKTYEGHLLDQIKELIKKASAETADKRKATMMSANNLQIQLLISLEQAGHFQMARETEKVILKYKMQYLH
ncbi:hypothetical protein [Curvivirga aplysinae]|uniref:hypothetical protein n=1 Tax=Curvivirga aplysinae TaxID=2529852 RepID=UPI0012BD50F7|nr:hypothetical protein [Curvivirga aplysinae]MTI09382.1 hypothetical protein [Curvivirga aplysinae]